MYVSTHASYTSLWLDPNNTLERIKHVFTGTESIRSSSEIWGRKRRSFAEKTRSPRKPQNHHQKGQSWEPVKPAVHSCFPSSRLSEKFSSQWGKLCCL